MILSKTDVAKRELESAIKIFFLSGDPILVHLAASASLNILRDIAAKNPKVETIQDKMLKLIKNQYKGTVEKAYSEAYNFMKHADRDHNETIDFNPDLNEFILFFAVEIYTQVMQELTGIMTALRLWFYINHEDVVLERKEIVQLKNNFQSVDFTSKRVYLDLAETIEQNRHNTNT